MSLKCLLINDDLRPLIVHGSLPSRMFLCYVLVFLWPVTLNGAWYLLPPSPRLAPENGDLPASAPAPPPAQDRLQNLNRIRNIGIMAHIDAGDAATKTHPIHIKMSYLTFSHVSSVPLRLMYRIVSRCRQDNHYRAHVVLWGRHADHWGGASRRHCNGLSRPGAGER